MLARNRQRWLLLWRRIQANGTGEAEFAHLVERYGESHRAYHTLVHIDHCLTELMVAAHCAVWKESVELALWYHDAVYLAREKGSEERSAALARVILENAYVDRQLVDKVASMILATKHEDISGDPDTKLLVDIDLAILGQPEFVFDEYEQNIRKEYEWVPPDVFVEGRSKILRSFLSRPRIYSTDMFWCRYEVRARENILRSLRRLAGQK